MILTNIFGLETAIEILQYSWMWKDSYLDSYSLRKLKILMEKDFHDSPELKEFIYEMEYAFEKESEYSDGTPDHIKQILDNYLNE